MRLGRNKRKLGYFIRYQLYDNDVNYHDVRKFLCLTEFDVSCKKQVETHLQGLAQHLHERLGARLKILPLTLSSLEAFGGNLEWVNPDRASTSWHGEAKTRLKAVFEDLVGLAKDDFEYDSCWPIYVVFLSFARGKIIAAGGKLDLEKIWIMFWEIGSENEEFLNFIELFEHIMIKSYSEAIAECVGSLMNLQIGSGRNLHPVNLNKELFLRFNLGPLHVIKVNLIPQVVKEKVDNERKEFFTKTTQKSLLKYDCLSASVGNFRKKEEESSHLPVSIF